MRVALALLMLAAMILIAPRAASAAACGPRLIVDYTEDSPDYFVLRNASDPGWSVLRVEIDLRETRGGVIFDVSELGAGVSAYQPYGMPSGTAELVGRTEVNDGDSMMSLAFRQFEPGAYFAFAIDLDDTLANGTQTWIAPAEMAGGIVRGVFGGPDGQETEREAPFDMRLQADTGRQETCLMS